jgi:glycosyltransferase involved in cell wall biosynthesis
MRIAINARLLGKKITEGVGRYTHEVIKSLSHQYPDDQIILYVDQNEIDTTQYGPNVSCRNLIVHPRHPILWYIWFEHLIPRALRQDDIDVFFSPEGMTSLRSRVPTVMTVHDVVFERYPAYVQQSHARFLKKNSIKYHNRADQIVAVSQFTKEEILDIYNIDSAKVTVVPNGRSNDFYQLSDDEKSTLRQLHDIDYEYILYVGSLHPRKNISRLIQSFEQFKTSSTSPIKLVLSGRLAWHSDDIADQLKQSPYPDDIIHLDFFEGDLNALVNKAVALIYPSLYEGFGLPVLEAMSAGTPVITSGHSAMSEVAGDSAIYFDPTSVDEMSHAIARIVVDDELRSKLCTKGLEQAQRFSWKDHAQEVYSLMIRTLT